MGSSLYIGSFYPAMTLLSRYLEEAAFSISISSSVFIFLWLFSRSIMDIVSSIVFISCPSCVYLAPIKEASSTSIRLGSEMSGSAEYTSLPP